MRFCLLLLFLLFFSTHTKANNNFPALVKSIKSNLESDDPKIALKKIDSVLLADFSTINLKNKTILEVYKVEALTSANLFDASLKLSKELLENTSLTQEQKIRVLLENALAYEVVGDFTNCKNKLDELKVIFNNKNTHKNYYYGKYLYRTSSFYRVQGIDEKAKKYALKAKEFGDKNSYNEVSAIASFLLGFIEGNKNEKYFKESLNYYKNYKNTGGITAMYLAIANVKEQKKLYKQALKYSDSGITLLKNTSRYNLLTAFYKFKIDFFEKTNKPDSLVYYLKKYQESYEKDKFYNQEIKVNEITSNLKLEEERERSKHFLKDLELEKQQRRKLYAALIGLLLFSSIILFLYLKNSIRKREIEKQKEALDLVNSKLSNSVDEKNILLKELHHRVKNNLSMILSLINLQTNELQNKSDRVLLENLEKRIETIAVTHDQFLYNQDQNEYSLRSYIDKVVFKLTNLHHKSIVINEDLEDILVSLDTALPIGFIINELITNSLKHANYTKQLEIFVKLKEVNNSIILEYSDNGLPTEEVNNKENIGLFLIDSMVKQLNGTYKKENFNYNFILNKK